MRRFFILFFLFASSAAAQGVRYSATVTQQGTIGTSTNAVVLPASPQIAFCNHPANAVPCTNKATTYQDQTLAVACSTSTQFVLDGTNTCVAAPDAQNNWGVWVAPNSAGYDYTITLAGGVNKGPFNVLSQTTTYNVPINLTGAGSAAVQTALNALVAGQTYLLPCGTYAGPTSIPSNVSLISVCSPDSLDFTNVLVPIVGNPVTMTNQTVFSYTANLALTNVQNVKMQGIVLDFARNNAGLILTSSSFNHFTDTTLRQCGGTAASCLTINTSAGTNGSFNSVFNVFDHLRITCNTLNTSTYCLSAVKFVGAGTVNAGSFATQNRFYDTFIGGNVLGFIDAELNSDTNYFWRVSMFEDLATPPAGSYLLGFNLVTPASDQDADGGVYDYVDFTGVGNPTSFLRAGQSNGNYIRITNNTGAIPSTTVLGGTPTYTVQTVGLAGTTTYFMQGGALVAAANPASVPNTLGAGQIMASQSANTGTLYLGSDTTVGMFRNGAAYQFFGGSGTLWQFLAGTSTDWVEGTAGFAGAAGHDTCYGDSTAHALKCSYNGGTYNTIAQQGTLTLKKGTGAGNYMTASTTYVVVDSTNLCQTVTIPTGWKLGVQVAGEIGSLTAVAQVSVAITDNAACSTANAGLLQELIQTPVASGTAQAINLSWVITGDGASHNIALQFKTAVAADSAFIQNTSSSLLPSMVLTLMPSN